MMHDSPLQILEDIIHDYILTWTNTIFFFLIKKKKKERQKKDRKIFEKKLH